MDNIMNIFISTDKEGAARDQGGVVERAVGEGSNHIGLFIIFIYFSQLHAETESRLHLPSLA